MISACGLIQYWFTRYIKVISTSNKRIQLYIINRYLKSRMQRMNKPIQKHNSFMSKHFLRRVWLIKTKLKSMPRSRLFVMTNSYSTLLSTIASQVSKPKRTWFIYIERSCSTSYSDELLSLILITVDSLQKYIHDNRHFDDLLCTFMIQTVTYYDITINKQYWLEKYSI